MTIQWRPAMEVGNQIIDTDHQRLVELINGVELTIAGGGDAAALNQVLDELVLYTAQHFGREEQILRGLRYGRYVQHREAHRALRARLAEIRHDLEAAQASGMPEAQLARLIELLRAWLLDHVLKEDLLVKPSLSGRPAHYAG